MSRLIKNTFQVLLSNGLISVSQVTRCGLTSSWLRALSNMNVVNLLGFLPEGTTYANRAFHFKYKSCFTKPQCDDKGEKHKLRDRVGKYF